MIGNPLKIDDRSIPQLLQTLLASYAQLPFVQDGEVKGNWDELFKDQLLFFLVDIHEANLFWWQKEREIILKNWNSTGRIKSTIFLSKLIQKFHNWYMLAERYEQWWIIKEMESCLLQLDLSGIQKALKKHENFQTVVEKIEQFIQRVQQNASFAPRTLGRKGVHRFEHNTNQFLNCLLQVQKELKLRHWDETISTEDHPPHVGLVYGFLKAYEKVQANLNQLPQVHLDYYVKTILQHKNAPVLADEVYLFFQLNDSYESFVLPKNTGIKGLGEDGKELVFETMESAYLTKAVISEVKSLLIDSSPEIAPLHHIHAITGIYQSDISPEKLMDDAALHSGISMFGEAVQEYQSNIGWAIASPAFLSDSGERFYELTLEVSTDSAKQLRDTVAQLFEKTSLHYDEIAFKFLGETLNLRITSAEAWETIEEYNVNYHELMHAETNKLSISFKLTASDPEWSAYTEEVHQEGYQTTFPILEIGLKAGSIYYPYSLLNQLEWESIGIRTKVKDCNTLKLYNKNGLVDPTASFPIFGLDPKLDDPFYIGAEEWVYKSLDSIDLSIHWDALPQPNLEHYYSGYETVKLKDKDFKVRFKQAVDEAEEFELFTVDEKEELQSSTNLAGVSLDMPSKKPSKRYLFDLSPRLVPEAFVELNLSSPLCGFGGAQFSEELSLFSQRKARDRKNKLDLKVPSVPFIPYVKQLKVDYESFNYITKKEVKSKQNQEQFDFFHVHPHGKLKVANGKRIEDDKLLPKLENRAYVYFGIEHLVKGAGFNLFFKFGESSISEKDTIDTRLEYLSGKSWVEIKQDYIIENTFQKGLGSGMLTFRVPYDIENNHPFYDPQKQWVRISITNEHAYAIGNCLLMRTNCSKAVRTGFEQSQSIQHIAPGVLSHFVAKELHQAVATISQPMASRGGKQVEAQSLYYKRIAQRLAHKNRAVRPEDFIQLLQERFSKIAWVKVATSTTNPKEINPGEVHLIVLPYFSNLEELRSWRLRAEEKEEMEQYLKSKCLMGVKVKVMAPRLEWVEAYVDIELNRMMNPPSIYELTDLINHAISPWAFDLRNSTEKIDGIFNTIDVLNALNQLNSIWRVPVCEAVQIIKTGRHFDYIDTAKGNEVLTPSSYQSIFIPTVKHKIRFIQDDAACLKDNTIGNMVIGMDLILKDIDEGAQLEKEKEQSVQGLYLLNSKN